MQYFRPSLSYHLSLRSLDCIFEWPFYSFYCSLKLIFAVEAGLVGLLTLE